jgi:hypothetical protein
LPLTPFHYPVAYIVHKLAGNLSLPAVVVGSMVPDLEIPVMVLLLGTNLPNRLVLHSLIGSLTVGTALAVAITVLIYPKLTSAIFPIDKPKLKENADSRVALPFHALLAAFPTCC